MQCIKPAVNISNRTHGILKHSLSPIMMEKTSLTDHMNFLRISGFWWSDDGPETIMWYNRCGLEEELFRCSLPEEISVVWINFSSGPEKKSFSSRPEKNLSPVDRRKKIFLQGTGEKILLILVYEFTWMYHFRCMQIMKIFTGVTPPSPPK